MQSQSQPGVGGHLAAHVMGDASPFDDGNPRRMVRPEEKERSSDEREDDDGADG